MPSNNEDIYASLIKLLWFWYQEILKGVFTSLLNGMFFGVKSV